LRILFLLFTALLCNLASAQTALPVQPHPLSGVWSWTLPGTSCSESLHYRTDGMRESRSGEEVTLSRYEVSALPGLTGFYRVTETVTESNAKADCAGDLHAAPGEAVIRFIQFSPRRDQLLVCREESLKACYGPLRRLPG